MSQAVQTSVNGETAALDAGHGWPADPVVGGDLGQQGVRADVVDPAVPVGCCFAPGSTQALPTDSPDAQNPVSTRASAIVTQSRWTTAYVHHRADRIGRRGHLDKLDAPLDKLDHRETSA